MNLGMSKVRWRDVTCRSRIDVVHLHVVWQILEVRAIDQLLHLMSEFQQAHQEDSIDFNGPVRNIRLTIGSSPKS
jgi:hypothetical protein